MRPERASGWCAIALACGLLAACASSGGGGVKKEDAATRNEEAARVHTQLGQKYMQQGKLELALDKLNKALSFDSGYADAHTVIALLYEKIGELKQAEEHYRRAVELKPKSGNELNNYGAFLCKLGRYDEADGYFIQAVADPFYKTPAVALTNAGTCLVKAGKYAAAENDLRQAVERAPDYAEGLFQLASVLYRKGDYFHARAFEQRFESVAQARPESLLLGRNIELKLGNGDAAREYTRRLLQGFPDSEQARALNPPNTP
ncbi:MAG TPA: type IV pilus biogenesis/stability protein PilW [Rhodanobacteraceae bacterium]|nr:type IV pilus biogenesis/stability protein PilW [Rhodanobacteraceae bacterium]